jgi:RND superfamily putative drug exporter
MKVYDRMQSAFPGGQIPATIVVKADDVTSPRMAQAVAELKRDALASGRVEAPITQTASKDGRVLKIDLPIAGDGNDTASTDALRTLREDVAPKFEQRTGSAAYVTGQTAESQDWNDLMRGRMPLVVAFVLALAFALLLVTFRSIVVPIKAIVLNLMSVAAAYGVVTFLFQDGHGEKALGFESTGAITGWLPLFLFVILFGLSMDYHVLVLSRVREAVDRGRSTDEAVEEGIRATASTVTSAAVVMVAVFGVFAALSYVDFKAMGVGLATAILIDATIVRAVLLPATMKLLGERNWYLPRRLEWIPRVAQPAHI